MSDFESELVDINHLVRNAESIAVEMACRLTIDDARCKRVCEDIAHLICIADGQLRREASRLNISVQQPLQQQPMQQLMLNLVQQSPIKQQPQQVPQQADCLQNNLNRGMMKLFDTAPPVISVQPPAMNASGSRFFNFN